MYSYQDYNVTLDHIPSSCCGRYDQNEDVSSQIGGCSLHEIETRAGCGLLFNESFQLESGYHNMLVKTFPFIAVVAIVFSLAFSWQIGNSYQV